MKYYIATSTSRIDEHHIVRDALAQYGHQITYDWTTHGSVRETSSKRLSEVAHAELQAICDADFVVVLLPGGIGTHTELGFSLAAKKIVFIHSEDPMAFEPGPQACAFYHHQEIIRLSRPIQEVAKAVQMHLVREENTVLTH